jgi:hypothetical protein
MSHEDRLRAAFDDLDRRVGEVPHRSWNPGRRPRYMAALAGAAAVVVVIGGAALFQLLPGEPPTSAPPLTQPTTVTTVPPSTTGTSQAPPSTQPGGGNRYRVDTEKVAADTDDPFLNVRWAAGAGSDLLAKLPPGYRGLAWTGATEATEDGATWYEVELLHPVAGVNPPEPLEGRNPRGWVNAAYLLPLPDGLSVGTAELAPCPAEGESGLADGPSDAHVYSLETARVADGCTRIVVGFGGGTLGYSWDDPSMEDVAPLDRVPAWNTVQEPWPLVIDLPATARVWPGATDADGVYVARSASLALQLVSLLPSDRTTVRSFDGWLVIDLEGGSQPIPPADGLVALTQQQWIGAGFITVSGLARPFEANLGVSVIDAAGNREEAVYSGSTFLGTIRTDQYAVQTYDWTEAWAPFSVEVAGLSPGSYILKLDADGASDSPRTLDIPFDITEAGEAPQPPGEEANQIASALAGFSSGGPAPSFADQVIVRLGNQDRKILSAAEAADRDNWTIEAALFNGYSGPFTPLGTLAGRPFRRITTGTVDHCASPPVDFWPGETVTPPPIHIEPIEIGSCLQWFDVVIRVDTQGRIQEVVLDLYEP